MSYELIFWKQDAEGHGPVPQAVYAALCSGQSVAGLAALPVDDMLEAIMKEFPGCERVGGGGDGQLVWDSTDAQGVFEVTWSVQHLRIDCRQVPDGDMNTLIDIAVSFGCPLYDPQIDERFSLHL